MTRLLLINPNISDSVTQLMADEARRSASAGTIVTALSAPTGVAYIETRFEALLGAHASALLAAEHAATHDAVIVAAFGDPGVAAIRELLDIPVIGLTEAALMSACMLGGRFSIVAISRRITAWYRETVAWHGLDGRLASIRHLDRPLRDVGTVQQDHEAALIALCNQAVDEDGADVVILAGGPLAGLARGVADRLPVPVVDGVSSAVRHAESLVALSPGRRADGAALPPRRGSYGRPPGKAHRGLPEAVRRLLDRS